MSFPESNTSKLCMLGFFNFVPCFSFGLFALRRECVLFLVSTGGWICSTAMQSKINKLPGKEEQRPPPVQCAGMGADSSGRDGFSDQCLLCCTWYGSTASWYHYLIKRQKADYAVTKCCLYYLMTPPKHECCHTHVWVFNFEFSMFFNLLFTVSQWILRFSNEMGG